jgi:hypothetical protein
MRVHPYSGGPCSMMGLQRRPLVLRRLGRRAWRLSLSLRVGSNLFIRSLRAKASGRERHDVDQPGDRTAALAHAPPGYHTRAGVSFGGRAPSRSRAREPEARRGHLRGACRATSGLPASPDAAAHAALRRIARLRVRSPLCSSAAGSTRGLGRPEERPKCCLRGHRRRGFSSVATRATSTRELAPG